MANPATLEAQHQEVPAVKLDAEGTAFRGYTTPTRDQVQLAQNLGTQDNSRHTFTGRELGGFMDDAIKHNDFSIVKQETTAALKSAYAHGGLLEADALIREMDRGTKTPGVGPVLVENGSKLEVHTVMTGDPPPGLSDDQAKSLGYLKGPDGGWVRDLKTNLAEMDRAPFDRAEQNADAADLATNLLGNANFARTGRLDVDPKVLEEAMRDHKDDMAQFNQAVNDMLTQSKSPFRLNLEMKTNQPGLHGNTVVQFNTEVVDARTNKHVDGLRSGYDTVRGISLGGPQIPQGHW